MTDRLPIALVGDGLPVPCVDKTTRPYLSLDAAASTAALPDVAERVAEFLPWYSSIHRGAGYKSQLATAAYEDARDACLAFAGRTGRDDVAIICRNTTEAVNHLAYRLQLEPGDVVVTTVIEHHANLLPWSRVATCRYVECDVDGTFSIEAVTDALDATPKPRLLAITGASNVTGWLPPVDDIAELAQARDIPTFIDAAQLAPHRPLPKHVDFIAWSGHKMYAPFGAGVLIGPRSTFSAGDPFLAGGGAVDLVDLDEVIWTDPPDREEAGSPNVIGAVALGAAIGAYADIGWDAIIAHDTELAERLRHGLGAIPGVRMLGPPLSTATLPVVSFVIEDVPHALVAARLSAEHAIGARHGCFCAHPYLTRLLNLDDRERARFREQIRSGDHRNIPGAVRVSAGLSTSIDDIDRFLAAVTDIARAEPAPVSYEQDPTTGDYRPQGARVPALGATRSVGANCARG